MMLSTTLGTWAGAPTLSFGIKWERNGVEVSGETSLTVDTDQVADVGTTWRSRITVTSPFGSLSVLSNPITLGAFTGAYARASSSLLESSSSILVSTLGS